MSEFKMSLIKVLGDAEFTQANGYEVETTYFGPGEVTLDLADETQLTLKEQEVTIDEFGESSAVDENGDEVSFKFQSSVPYKPVEMMQRPRAVLLVGADGRSIEVTSNVAMGVLVLRHAGASDGAEEEERFKVKGSESSPEQEVWVTGDVRYLEFSEAGRRIVDAAFEAERLNRETFLVEVLGVDEDGHEFEVGSWTAVGCATEAQASKQAIEEVWDRRLDIASCSPKTVVSRNPRWEESLPDESSTTDEQTAVTS